VERVAFTRCPYDASPIEADTSAGGSVLLCCFTCGAAWQWYRTWLRRVHEPDREVVRRARLKQDPRQVRNLRDPDPAEAAWRHVSSSSSSIVQGSNLSPPRS
jgi:hypothetical protein